VDCVVTDFKKLGFGLKTPLRRFQIHQHVKKWLCLSDALLLAPKSDNVTTKEGKFIKEAFFSVYF